MNKWIVNPRQRCDLEMLLAGGFSPLKGFMNRADYENVVSQSRLANGQIWPMPITLDVDEACAEKVEIGSEIGLFDPDNTQLAKMTVTDKWQPDKVLEARQIFETEDPLHPGVDYLNRSGKWYVGGTVELVQMPRHYESLEIRHTPASLKQFFAKMGWKKIVGFQTRNPMHRAHMELTLRAAEHIGGHVLIHPVVGLTKPGDIDYFTRVRCYQKILRYYPQQKATLSLLPLAMRMGGPKEALWHALIRKNYGCTHFIVGRDHAGPGNDSKGKPFYDPYAAQEAVRRFQHEIGIEMLPFQEMVFVKERQQYCPNNEIKTGETAMTVSGTQLREMLLKDKPIPEWFSFPEVIQELRHSCPPKHKQGFTLFFTGLSGAGKSTLAQALRSKLMSWGHHNISFLDGDVVRHQLSSELGFSKAHRDLNVRRIGFVASEITKVGGIAICAAIAPYIGPRKDNRHLISQHGGYVEVYVAASVAACQKRDTKGLYAKALKGELQGFTGVNDPYETPENPEIVIDTEQCTLDEGVEKIINYLVDAGYLKLHERISSI